MSLLDLLTRMNPATGNWMQVSQGIRSISAHDVAAALSGLSVGAYCLAQWYGCQDESVWPILQAVMLEDVKQLAKQERWWIRKDIAQLERLTWAVIMEMLHPPICRTCHGTGVQPSQICKSCQGNGQARAERRLLAKRCNVPESNWSKIWEPKYHAIMMIFNQYEYELIKQLREKLLGVKRNGTHQESMKTRDNSKNQGDHAIVLNDNRISARQWKSPDIMEK